MDVILYWLICLFPTFMTQLPHFTEQRVRDLAWAIFGPNLIDDFSVFQNGQGLHGFHVDLTPQRIDWLFELDRNPTPLLEAQHTLKSIRLGLYFELLWRFFLRADPAYELIGANIPVFDQSQTLGEFDLLLYDKENRQSVHLELATKYYLKTTSPTPGKLLSEWVGPNTRDRLDLKLDRLLSHQARLSELPQGKQTLSALIQPPLRAAIALKGWLFYQEPSTNTLNEDSGLLNPSHNRGTWMPYTAIAQHADTAEYWHILQRPNWLSPVYIDNPEACNHQLILPEDLDQVLNEIYRGTQVTPLMLCGLKERKSRITECARHMVTGDQWPENLRRV